MVFDRRKITYLIIIMIVVLLISSYFMFRSPWKFRENRPIKILYLNSYESDLYWSNDAISAFEEVFYEEEIEFELKRFDMDTKVRNTEEDILLATENAKKIIDEWQPDLVVAGDDNAQKYVVVDYINTDIPFVFFGVGADPEDYGFDEAKNVAGVLERYLLRDAVDLIKQVNSYAKRGVFITDMGTTGDRAIRWIEHERASLEDVNFVALESVESFDDYKDIVLKYNEDNIDFFIMRGLDTFKDETGVVINSSDVVKWTIENSDILEVGFADRFSRDGFLFSVVVTAEGQGEFAAIMAIDILINGKRPSKIPFIPSIEGRSFVNIKRAEMLGVAVPSDVLLKSEIIDTFFWE